MATLALYAADAAGREKLAALAWDAGCRILGHAETPHALVRLMEHGAVDAILALLPQGGELSAWLAERRAPFIAIARSPDPGAMRAAFAAGAAALLGPGAGADELRLALEALKHGLSIVPAALGAAPMREDRSFARDIEPASSGDSLTPRELEVLAALADGASNKAIARRLGISFHTAKFHVAAILDKLDADSRTEAVAEAARRGLVML